MHTGGQGVRLSQASTVITRSPGTATPLHEHSSTSPRTDAPDRPVYHRTECRKACVLLFGQKPRIPMNNLGRPHNRSIGTIHEEISNRISVRRYAACSVIRSLWQWHQSRASESCRYFGWITGSGNRAIFAGSDSNIICSNFYTSANR